MYIQINGPSYGGKTMLTLNLIHSFPSFEVVQFEKFYNKYKDIRLIYKSFFEDIQKRLDNNKNVISESVVSYKFLHGNNYKSLDNFLNPDLKILCMPNYQLHVNGYNNYYSKHGNKYCEQRGGSIKRRVNEHYCKVPDLIYNGNNLSEVINLIREKI